MPVELTVTDGPPIDSSSCSRLEMNDSALPNVTPVIFGVTWGLAPVFASKVSALKPILMKSASSEPNRWRVKLVSSPWTEKLGGSAAGCAGSGIGVMISALIARLVLACAWKIWNELTAGFQLSLVSSAVGSFVWSLFG